MAQGRMKTINMLKEARNRMISRAVKAERSGRQDEKNEWERRKKVLEAEMDKLRTVERSLPARRVFVSYSVHSGRRYFRILERMLREANFEVTHGFKETRGVDGNVLKTVLKQLRDSTVYVAILSKEIQIGSGKKIQWAPGVWVIEEKGMALALEKPFILLVDKDIVPEFYMKTVPEKHHTTFGNRNFRNMAREVVNQVNDRYEDYIRRRFSRLRD